MRLSIFQRRPASFPNGASADELASRQAITRFLFVRDEPEPVDFAFVLGSPTLSSVEPAITLYKQGLTPKILISGKGPEHAQADAPAEAQVYRDHALCSGVAADAVLIEDRATNTLENFRFSHAVVERHLGWHNVRAVSISGKPFHMRRALMTARAQWPAHLKIVMLPSSAADDPPADTWWQTPHGRNFVLNELRAIGCYGLQGDLGGF
jgi:uncharacterized SAM-binding protein YcdF (DUF218 family)